MRNPDRIKPCLKTLEKAWDKVPDWRFGQLIENLSRYLNLEDLFFIEDDRMEETILDMFEIDKKNKDEN